MNRKNPTLFGLSGEELALVGIGTAVVGIIGYLFWITSQAQAATSPEPSSSPQQSAWDSVSGTFVNYGGNSLGPPASVQGTLPPAPPDISTLPGPTNPGPVGLPLPIQF
jgi:hypothetical protein